MWKTIVRSWEQSFLRTIIRENDPSSEQSLSVRNMRREELENSLNRLWKTIVRADEPSARSWSLKWSFVFENDHFWEQWFLRTIFPENNRSWEWSILRTIFLENDHLWERSSVRTILLQNNRSYEQSLSVRNMRTEKLENLRTVSVVCEKWSFVTNHRSW